MGGGGAFCPPLRRGVRRRGGNVVDLAIASEEIGRYSADVAMAFGGSMFCALNVARKGSEEQKRHWLPKLISGEIRMSISMSEPDAGSDVGAMRTQARRDGNEYLISGPRIEDMSAADGLWTESVAQAVSMTSEDARAGIDAFFGKRKIKF